MHTLQNNRSCRVAILVQLGQLTGPSISSMPLMRKGSFSTKVPEMSAPEKFSRATSDPADRPFRINMRGRASGEFQRASLEAARETRGPVEQPEQRVGRPSLDLERPALVGGQTDFRRAPSFEKPLPQTRSGSAGRGSTESRRSQEQAFRINTHGRKSEELPSRRRSEELLTRTPSDSPDRPFRINTHGRASGEMQRKSLETPDRSGDGESGPSVPKAAKGAVRGWVGSLRKMFRS